MYGVVFVETSSGSPVFYTRWKDGFGVPDMSVGAGAAVPSGQIQATTLAALVSALRARGGASFGGSLQVERIHCAEVVLTMLARPEHSLLGVVTSSVHVCAKYLDNFLTRLTLHFIANHSDAIKSAAAGRIRSLKKVMKPAVSQQIWSCISLVAADVLNAVQLLFPATTWVLCTHSPELSLAVQKAPNIFLVRGGDVKESMSGLFGAYTLHSTENGPAWPGGMDEEDVVAGVLRLVLATSRTHRLRFSRSPQHISHTKASGTALHVLVIEDTYLAFEVPISVNKHVNAAFLPQLLSSEIPPLQELLRFAYANSIAKTP